MGIKPEQEFGWFERIINLYEIGQLTFYEVLDLCWTNLGNPKDTCMALLRYAIELRNQLKEKKND